LVNDIYSVFSSCARVSVTGISAATNSLKLGAALFPLLGPANTKFFALAPYGFFVSPYASLSEIVVLALEPVYAVEVLDCTGDVAPIVTEVIPVLVLNP